VLCVVLGLGLLVLTLGRARMDALDTDENGPHPQQRGAQPKSGRQRQGQNSRLAEVP